MCALLCGLTPFTTSLPPPVLSVPPRLPLTACGPSSLLAASPHCSPPSLRCAAAYSPSSRRIRSLTSLNPPPRLTLPGLAGPPIADPGLDRTLAPGEEGGSALSSSQSCLPTFFEARKKGQRSMSIWSDVSASAIRCQRHFLQAEERRESEGGGGGRTGADRRFGALDDSIGHFGEGEGAAARAGRAGSRAWLRGREHPARQLTVMGCYELL